MDHKWEQNKEAFPDLRQAPSEYIRDHVRFNTQPVEEPETNEQLRQLLELMDGDELLLYASDFPHWDFDNPDRTLTTVSPEVRRRIFADNASEVFAL
jgi:predicted TIM-barrel fold metal-dependent hydrolase